MGSAFWGTGIALRIAPNPSMSSTPAPIMCFWTVGEKIALTTFFSVVTLPVEINASQRAVEWLGRAGVVDAATRPQAVDALKWAAYTYVIAAIGSLATLFYYISLGNRR